MCTPSYLFLSLSQPPGPPPTLDTNRFYSQALDSYSLKGQRRGQRRTESQGDIRPQRVGRPRAKPQSVCSACLPFPNSYPYFSSSRFSSGTCLFLITYPGHLWSAVGYGVAWQQEISHLMNLLPNKVTCSLRWFLSRLSVLLEHGHVSYGQSKLWRQSPWCRQTRTGKPFWQGRGTTFLLPATKKPAVTETDFYSWFIERVFNVEEQGQASQSDRHGSKLL